MHDTVGTFPRTQRLYEAGRRQQQNPYVRHNILKVKNATRKISHVSHAGRIFLGDIKKKYSRGRPHASAHDKPNTERWQQYAITGTMKRFHKHVVD